MISRANHDKNDELCIKLLIATSPKGVLFNVFNEEHAGVSVYDNISIGACHTCGRRFIQSVHSLKIYCTNKCRQRALYQRRHPTAAKYTPKFPPILARPSKPNSRITIVKRLHHLLDIEIGA